MLAGVVILVAVIAALVFGLPWLVSTHDVPDALDGDPNERFSDSMFIVRSTLQDYLVTREGAEVSTLLTRRAKLAELRDMARFAAKRRAQSALMLVGCTIVAAILVALRWVPWWVVVLSAGILTCFLVLSPILVRAMHRRFDERAATIADGFGDEEPTTKLHLEDFVEDEESVAIDVDLTLPRGTESLWDAVPVTAPTYVSKPLMPRTVRTIDLSAPINPAPRDIPTADHPDRDVEEIELETERISRLRVVGE